MTSSFLRKMLLTGACVLGASVASGNIRHAMAQDVARHGPTPEQKAEMERVVHEAVQHDMQSVAQYPLPKDFFARMLPMMQQITQAHISPPIATSNTTLAMTIRRMEAMQQLQPILQRNGMSARDFVMSITCFGMTTALLQDQKHKNSTLPHLNPANVRLIQSHEADAQALIQVMSADEDEESLEAGL
ncbi:hypothetical protein [Novacetimonas pomaceti]|uniref:hypothetical protein n=1 Tax=Novacetimonas pomaceti TaxID=2021998 RepID=UPI001C2CDC5F|nr:hypothetical protein [Novacetimonas pomaceti]MBV1834077.1 hypothetical protein [Novacetimonas pomaceti]